MIVVTDRPVLDQQLQDDIYQIDHAKHVVVKIDKNSTQLAEALLGESAKVIITTLLKFPFILGKTSASKARKNAVIVDEAHSSQSGVAAMALRAALTKGQDAAAALIVAERQEQEEKARCDGQDPITLALAGRGGVVRTTSRSSPSARRPRLRPSSSLVRRSKSTARRSRRYFY